MNQPEKSASLSAISKFAALPEILRAAQVLERHGLLQPGEKANDVVKRFVNDNPDINQTLASLPL